MPETLEAPVKQAQQPKSAWKMPEVELGETVIHFMGADSKEAYAAFVTRLGTQALSLAILIDGRANMTPVDGCRHRDDPKRQPEDRAGMWVTKREYAALSKEWTAKQVAEAKHIADLQKKHYQSQ